MTAAGKATETIVDSISLPFMSTTGITRVKPRRSGVAVAIAIAIAVGSVIINIISVIVIIISFIFDENTTNSIIHKITIEILSLLVLLLLVVVIFFFIFLLIELLNDYSVILHVLTST